MTTESIVKKKTRTTKKNIFPKKYKVVIYNDDVTPIDFVIAMLVTIFRHTQENAYNITMDIHNKEKGVAGMYNYEIAEQKSLDAISLARYHGWPLIIKIEEE